LIDGVLLPAAAMAVKVISTAIRCQALMVSAWWRFF